MIIISFDELEELWEISWAFMSFMSLDELSKEHWLIHKQLWALVSFESLWTFMSLDEPKSLCELMW